MRLTGETTIPAPPDAVWRALNDPAILRQSIPGCESLEKLSDTAFKATVATRLGPVNARFQGDVTLSDLDPPHGYTLTGQGSGGAAGNAKGVARIRLEAAEGGTRLAYDIDAQVSGKLAQLGARLLQSAANMMAAQFFDRFRAAVTGEKPAMPSPAAVFVTRGLLILAAVMLVILLVLMMM